MATDEGGAPVMASLALDPSLIETETCGWPVVYADCGGSCDAYERWPEAEREAAQALFEAQAIDLLWNWTERMYGVCPTTIRPCRDDCGGASATSTFWGRGPGYDPSFPRAGRGGTSTGGWTPVLIGGKWMNVGCGCLSACRCGIDGAHALSLPGPVQSITQVRVNGEIVPPSAYRVDHKRLLVRIDGGTWPACQNLLAEPTEEDTFEVTYERGIPVPVGGMVAAGRLACELALYACDDEDCALPERWQSIQRQGISITAALSNEKWHDTGIWSIDNWVNSITERPRGFAAVRSVDRPPRRY
ncbi:head-to-tail adaptor [Microbacterium phage MementoMori]|uniref:Head-to-tail adaptor n=1 Tax=Microbacterium phage MementoMori TaxID=2201436 RepID=A0A2Z4Q5J9_9CAUD|nr:head-tail adaptor [Microbacterium phage MementoMori]AWY05281.1 head-to-tail adaptor [Microbacterium phage MementoMori]